jgi:FtsZ-binding cell division protein ZapB
MNELLNELGIRKDSIASSMIDKIKQKETIELLQSYDISILKELNKTLNQEANDLYQIVHKRRMAYVEKVRKHSNGQGGFIDFNSDQDDTANLSCGITAIYNVMDKIDKIIVKKMNVINEQKNKNYMCNMITMVLIALPILYVFL